MYSLAAPEMACGACPIQRINDVDNRLKSGEDVERCGEGRFGVPSPIASKAARGQKSLGAPLSIVI